MRLPIEHWSYSSLVSFLRNPLAWRKRYVEKIYDTPSTSASVIGRAGHFALEHFYGQIRACQASGNSLKRCYQGASKEIALERGLAYLRDVGDFEIDFGKATSRRAKKEKRARMEEEYRRAVAFYLARPPRHQVLGVEVKGVASVEGLPIPLKAVSDLVVAAREEAGAVDIIDHKFVSAFSRGGAAKTLFLLQAFFNYHTVRELFGAPVHSFVVYECKKTKNADGSAQLRRYRIRFKDHEETFAAFFRLIRDATEDLSRRRVYLPNPSDMFEGENSFDIYRLSLAREEGE